MKSLQQIVEVIDFRLQIVQAQLKQVKQQLQNYRNQNNQSVQSELPDFFTLLDHSEIYQKRLEQLSLQNQEEQNEDCSQSFQLLSQGKRISLLKALLINEQQHKIHSEYHVIYKRLKNQKLSILNIVNELKELKDILIQHDMSMLNFNRRLLKFQMFKIARFDNVAILRIAQIPFQANSLQLLITGVQKGMQNLKVLQLVNCKLSNEHWYFIATFIHQFTKIESLNLQNNIISQVKYDQLICLIGLKYLNLYNNKLSSSSLQMLNSFSQQNPNFKIKFR